MIGWFFVCVIDTIETVTKSHWGREKGREEGFDRGRADGRWEKEPGGGGQGQARRMLWESGKGLPDWQVSCEKSKLTT
jgi:hypothetical protein